MAPTSDAAPDVRALIARARKIIENGSPEQLDVLAVVGLRSHYRQQSREDAYRLLGALADALENTEADVQKLIAEVTMPQSPLADADAKLDRVTDELVALLKGQIAQLATENAALLARCRDLEAGARESEDISINNYERYLTQIQKLETENAALRAELGDQWELNHSEHCGCLQPDSEACNYRKPDAMQAHS